MGNREVIKCWLFLHFLLRRGLDRLVAMESGSISPHSRGTKDLQLMILGGDLYLELLHFSLCVSCFCVTRSQAFRISVPK